MEERVTVATLWDTIEAYLANEGVELDDLRWSGRVLKVTVDAAGGVDVDRIAELARGLSRLVDDDPSLVDSYTLEVSSPGLERPLRRPEHYAKSLGREVAITTGEAVAGETHHRGVLEAFDGSTVALRVGDGDRAIPIEIVESARTLFSWEPATKPGKKKGS
jgi:ribosome maturation factor RimP